MLKLDFFFHTPFEARFFFTKNWRSASFFFNSRAWYSYGCFCPSVDPIDYCLCNLSKQTNFFNIQAGPNYFFQPKAAPDYFFKKSFSRPPPIMKWSLPYYRTTSFPPRIQMITPLFPTVYTRKSCSDARSRSQEMKENASDNTSPLTAFAGA